MSAGKSKGDGFRNPHNLPVKVCVVCDRPFTWRKKWEKCWDEVLTCSNRCKTERRAANRAARSAADSDEADDRDESDDGAPARRSQADDAGRGRGGSGRGRGESGRRGGKKGGAVAAASFAGVVVDVEEPALDCKGDAIQDAWAAAEAELQEPPADLEDALVDGVDGDGSARDFHATLRRAQKKALKEERRARRAQSQEEAAAAKRKPCDLCEKRVDLLIRCTTDVTAQWRMVCGRCWKDVSGGVPDGDAEHPHYRYGGLWKNRAAGNIQTPSFAGKATAGRAAYAPEEEENDDDDVPATLPGG